MGGIKIMDLVNRIDNYLMKGLNEDTLTMLELAMFMDENEYMLSEAIGDWGKKVGSLLKKVGLHVHSGEGGLIQILTKSSVTMGKLFWNLMKAFTTGDSKAKEKVKEIVKTEITKEQVLDFLLRVDTLTLHLITGPIHMLDALTGWHIAANIKKASQPTVKRAMEAIENLKEMAVELKGSIKKIVLDYIHGLKRLLGLEKGENVA